MLTVKRGKATILGYEATEGTSIVIPIGRRVLVKIEGSASISGESAAVPTGEQEFRIFDEASEKIVAYRRVIIIGPTDHGKSTLSAWVVNKLSSLGREVAYMTTDVGQNEIFSPAFESIARVNPPAIPGSSLSFDVIDSCFVGSFSPTDNIRKYLDCAAELSSRAGQVVIDTDGWVRGEEALKTKARLASLTGSEAIVSIGLSKEEVELLRKESGMEVIELPRLVNGEKSQSERRSHRERLIVQRLLGSKPRLVASEIVEGLPVFAGKTLKLPFSGVVYAEEIGGKIVAVFRGRAPPVSNAALLKEGWERGLLLAVRGEGIHLGVLDKIYYDRRMVRILTPYDGRIERVEVGKVKAELESLTFLR